MKMQRHILPSPALLQQQPLRLCSASIPCPTTGILSWSFQVLAAPIHNPGTFLARDRAGKGGTGWIQSPAPGLLC